MNKLVIKIIVSVIGIIVLGLALLWVNQEGGAKTDGTIQIILIDEAGQELVNDFISYQVINRENKRTTLHTILAEHYQIVVQNGMLIEMQGVHADTTEYFLKIWINCQAANYGIDHVTFLDGDVIHIVYTRVGDYRAPC